MKKKTLLNILILALLVNSFNRMNANIQDWLQENAPLLICGGAICAVGLSFYNHQQKKIDNLEKKYQENNKILGSMTKNNSKRIHKTLQLEFSHRLLQETHIRLENDYAILHKNAQILYQRNQFFKLMIASMSEENEKIKSLNAALLQTIPEQIVLNNEWYQNKWHFKTKKVADKELDIKAYQFLQDKESFNPMYPHMIEINLYTTKDTLELDDKPFNQKY